MHANRQHLLESQNAFLKRELIFTGFWGNGNRRTYCFDCTRGLPDREIPIRLSHSERDTRARIQSVSLLRIGAPHSETKFWPNGVLQSVLVQNSTLRARRSQLSTNGSRYGGRVGPLLASNSSADLGHSKTWPSPQIELVDGHDGTDPTR